MTVGPSAGGARITLTGKNFRHVQSVAFGAAAGKSVKVESATKLLVTAPAHKPGRVDVRVRTASGTSKVVTADRFTYLAAPGPVSGASVVASTTSSLTLRWKDPSTVGFAGVLIRRAVGTKAPGSPTAGTLVVRTGRSAASYTVHGLVAGTHYAFALFAYNQVNRYSKAADVAGFIAAPPQWTAAEAPLPGDASEVDAELVSVGCDGPGSCSAVGDYTTADGGQGLIDSLSGGAWTSSTAPLPDDGELSDAALSSVSCGEGSCAAVGHYESTATGTRGLIDVGSGGSWAAAKPVVPDDAATDPDDGLASVGCGGGHCVAFGSYLGTDSNFHPLLDVITGGGAGAYKVPLPGNAAAMNPAPELKAVSCGSDGTCVVAGDYRDTNLQLQGLLLVLSGGGWSAREAPLPADSAGFGDLASVSCGGSGSCVAVGTYSTDSAEVGLIETLSGGAWKAAAAPAVTNTTLLNAVGCATSTSCVAVGTSEDLSGDTNGVLETLSGGTWSVTMAPLPANAASNQDAELLSVACGTASVCSAVGQYTDGSNTPRALINTLSGGVWTATEAPLPANANPALSRVSLRSVGCGSAEPCVAVGTYSDAGTDGDTPPLTETEN